ncbi:cyclin-SDS [Humulus lupulus]|uniref:cyclin-SDS n=1 Tax=Humulus lupulus TaxID=3486 RepID=UPI002B40D3DF|nr:cyclin-SDS [Humulus lupulus]
MRTSRSSTTRANKELQEMPSVKKKLRSERPRRRRTRISPVVVWNRNIGFEDKNSGFASFSVDSSSCSYFGGDVSCQSSRVSVGSESKGKSILRKREFCEPAVKSCCDVEASEVSEFSCVESNQNCGAGNEVSEDGRLMKLKIKRAKGNEIVEELEGSREREEDSKAVISASCIIQLSGNGNLNISKENEVVSCISASESCFEANRGEKTKQDISTAQKLEFGGVSGNCLDNNFTVSNSESTIDQRPEISFGITSDLACAEQYSDTEVSSTHETACSELQSEIFLDTSDLDFSDYTPSMLDSGSEFSEKSEGDSASSITFALLIQYRNVFFRSTSAQDVELDSNYQEEYIDQSRYARFEDEAEEESYQMLRNRERRRVVLRDYIEEYSSTTDYGNLILHQRRKMIRWIIGRCQETDLQQETTFLGVCLLDRFLSKGFFKNKKILQIVGIACLALATRMEENQPYNSVRQKNISFGNDTYSRCEVVAMEWLVQEVLDFQCFLPTIYNFLWFYLKAAAADEEVEKRAKYLAALLLPDRVQMYFMPSTVAAAVVILACLESSSDLSIQRVIETHIRTECNDLYECIQSLEWLLKYI